MVLYEVKDYEEMSRKAAAVIAAQVVLKPDAVLGLATGSTPLGAYEQLVKWYQKKEVDFSGISSVNLDEYKGLGGDNRQSYRYFMDTNLFQHINIEKSRTFVPDGLEADSGKACREYDEVIRKLGGIDLQILGIGANGHIGFNEPGESFEKGTHCVNLAESTIQANARFFQSLDEVPRQAYTMGMKGILSAGKILLLAAGESKADALYQALYGPVSPQLPASILQLHRDVAVIADQGACARLRRQGAAVVDEETAAPYFRHR